MTAVARFIDPAELLRISNLELLARTVVEGFLTGLHRSPHSGVSIEFAQYRPYAQGDDPRFVDWKLYGRTDRLHVKQFVDETNLRCTILIDRSASMDYASGAVSKFDYARMLAAALTTILAAQRDAVGLIAYDEETRVYIPPRAEPLHPRRILTELENLRPEKASNPDRPLAFLGDVVKPRGMVILISDLLHPVEKMVEHLKSLRARRHDVAVFQIVDPAEETFPFDRTVTLVDAEDAREMYAIPDLIRREYLENRRRHFAEIRRECLRAEIELEEFRTDEPLDRALHFFLRRRGHSTMSSGRRRRGGGA